MDRTHLKASFAGNRHKNLFARSEHEENPILMLTWKLRTVMTIDKAHIEENYRHDYGTIVQGKDVPEGFITRASRER